MREPAGEQHVHRGTDELRSLFTRFFSNGGGIPLEHCTVTTRPRLRDRVQRRRLGADGLPPQAGIAVYVRGAGGKLAAARIYDDVDPPL